MEQITDGSEIAQAVLSTIEATKLCGEYWPNDAVFAITYSTKCWPCGWDEPRAKFFASVAEMVAWRVRYNEWAKLEDNYYEIESFYEWDWGPCRRDVRDFVEIVEINYGS